MLSLGNIRVCYKKQSASRSECFLGFGCHVWNYQALFFIKTVALIPRAAILII